MFTTFADGCVRADALENDLSTLNPSPAVIHAMDREPAPPLPLTSTLTFRNWRRTLLWTLGAVLACCLLYVVDKYGLWFPFARRDTDYRMFKNPSEIPMRIFGLPHFIIALLFVGTSRRMRQPRNIAIFLGLLLLGTAFCVVFYRFGAHENPFLLFLFYFYFLIHGFRDESFFYKAYGDMPAEGAKTHARVMNVIQLLALGLMLSLLWPTYVQASLARLRTQDDPVLKNFFPADWPFILRLGSMFVPMVIIALFALRRIARSFPDGLAGLWRVHRPILAIWLISIGIVLLALVGGPWTFNVVVLMHFVGWYLFALFLIGRNQPKEPLKGIWPWMRTTRAGFMTLHLGLAALVTLLIAIDVYGFGKESWLDNLVGSKNFYYWTVMHVTLSFLPR